MPRISRSARLRSQISDKIGVHRTDDEFALDKQIANRLRAGRGMRDVSQQMLAEKIGITCKQVQKYEAANNRIAASRLIMIAKALGLPPTWFFSGIPGPSAQDGSEFPAVLSLLGRISRLPERERRAVTRLVHELER